MSFLFGIRMYSLWAAQCRATCDRPCQPVKLNLSQTSRQIQLRDQHWCLPSTRIHCGEGFPAPPPWCTIHVLQKKQQEERGNLNESADCSQHLPTLPILSSSVFHTLSQNRLRVRQSMGKHSEKAHTRTTHRASAKAAGPCCFSGGSTCSPAGCASQSLRHLRRSFKGGVHVFPLGASCAKMMQRSKGACLQSGL